MKKWGNPVGIGGSTWQYYIEKKFAFLPIYIDGGLVWLQSYWVTFPANYAGVEIEGYRSMYASDPGPGPGLL